MKKWLGLSLAVLALAVPGMSTPNLAIASPDVEQQLVTSLQNYFATQSPKYTLSIRELGGGNNQVSIDANLRVEPASVIKLFWAWATLHEVDAGRLSLAALLQPGFTWSACLDLMIKVSDNTCAGWIREGLGNTNLNQLLSAEGYLDTQIVLDEHGAYKTKFTTAADTSLLLQRIEAGTALSPSSTAYFHQLLKEQVFRSRITAGVQRGYTVENKGGELWVPGGWIESDAAIVRGPISTYVLVIYGRNNAKNPQIAKASQIIFEKLQNRVVTSPTVLPIRQYLVTATVWVRKTANGRFAYRAKKGALVELILADRDWVEIKQTGHRVGFVRFSNLKLRSAYVWP